MTIIRMNECYLEVKNMLVHPLIYTYHLELGKILNTNHLILQELNCPENMKRTNLI